jgi:FkbM family methyltransferase
VTDEVLPATRFTVFDVPGAGKFYLDDFPGIVQSTLRRGEVKSPNLLAAFRTHAKRGTTAIDIGAHIGSLAVPFGHFVGPNGRLYAFEPQRALFVQLFHNLRLNGLDHATAIRMAISSAPGTLEMNATPEVWDPGWGSIGKGGEVVEARTIDSFSFQNVSFIKIDVEGHEREVLEGALETIEQWRPAMLIEIRPENLSAITSLLTEMGYRIESNIVPEWAQDHLAVHRDGSAAVSRPD